MIVKRILCYFGDRRMSFVNQSVVQRVQWPSGRVVDLGSKGH